MISLSVPSIRGSGTLIALSIIFFILDTFLWIFVSIAENNSAIAAIHILFAGFAIFLILIMGGRLLLPFSVALIIRSFFAVMAWFTAFNFDRKYYIGTNTDASRFWEGSFFSYEQASLGFEDPLFPWVNVFVTKISAQVGDVSYLATTQTVLFAGALTVPFIQRLAENLYGHRIGILTAYLYALCPTAIVFSTGLMRDSLMGMFGALFLMALSLAIYKERIGLKVTYICIALSAGVALAYLRTITLAGYILGGFILVVSRTPYRSNCIPRGAKYLGLLALLVLMGFSVLDRPDRYINMFEYGRMVRDGSMKAIGSELNSEGITTIIGEISPALYLVIWPISLLQPIPFFNWDAPYYEPGPPALMDIVLGFGGLYVQILFGFFIYGARWWVLNRDSLGFRIGVLLNALICTGVMVGLGQIRMVMASCYPFLFIGIAIGFLSISKYGYLLAIKVLFFWALFMLGLYGAYFSYKYLGILWAFSLSPIILASFWLFWVEVPINDLKATLK